MQTHGPAPEEQASFPLTKPDEDIGSSDLDEEEPVEEADTKGHSWFLKR
jgi:hypothetical protein